MFSHRSGAKVWFNSKLYIVVGYSYDRTIVLVPDIPTGETLPEVLILSEENFICNTKPEWYREINRPALKDIKSEQILKIALIDSGFIYSSYSVSNGNKTNYMEDFTKGNIRVSLERIKGGSDPKLFISLWNGSTPIRGGFTVNGIAKELVSAGMLRVV